MDVADDLPSVFTRADAHAAGLSDTQISRRLRTGCWRAVRPGTYTPSHGPEPLSEEAKVALRVADVAACLARYAPDAVATHESAAAVLGIATLGRDDTVHLARASGSHGRRVGCVVRRVRLPQQQLCAVSGIATTTAARTVFDIARARSFRAGVVAADSALYLRLTSREELDGMLRECHVWPGVRKAARVIAFADGRAETPIESLARVLCLERGLPIPEPQQLIKLDGVVVARVDLLFDDRRTVVETDGRLKYGNRKALWAEKDREDLVRDAGYEVARLTWEYVTRRPAEAERRIREAFKRAAA